MPSLMITAIDIYLTVNNNGKNPFSKHFMKRRKHKDTRYPIEKLANPETREKILDSINDMDLRQLFRKWWFPMIHKQPITYHDYDKLWGKYNEWDNLLKDVRAIHFD